jgi:hypothetical protein
VTIEQHLAAVRKDRKGGMANLVTTLRTDPEFAHEAKRRLALYAQMDRVDRLRACWISMTIKDTLTAAFAVVNAGPGVPAGG